MPPEARAFTAGELHIGLKAEFERDITELEVLDFATNSGDQNPLHVDSEYAHSTNYGRRIVHGAFQVGLASAMLGMHLPGRNVLLASVHAQFPEPLYFPCRVRVQGEIISWQRETLRGNLKVTISEAVSKVPTSQVFLGFTFHESKVPQPNSLVQPAAAGRAEGRRTVLITGASGGIGSFLTVSLAQEYHVIALVNRTLPNADIMCNPEVTIVQTDLSDEGWFTAVEAALGNDPLYGTVHAAWPGMPKGGLLTVQEDLIRDQLAFGTLYPIRLARFAVSRAGPEGGRLVLLGSVAGSHKPTLSAAAYSLGKAAMEHTLKLLAPELARKGVTVNGLAPSFVPVGINRHSTERQRTVEASLIPMGRLCDAQDVVEAVRFLLAPGSSFLSGQVIGLSGGQL